MITPDPFAAGEQYLGYTYQARFALLHLLRLPEEAAVLIEADDDLDFTAGGVKTLASLKHKEAGDRLTNLSVDFWKSVNIWLARYKRDGRVKSPLRFLLFTTATIAQDSFLTIFAPDSARNDEVVTLADTALSNTRSKVITPIKALFDELSADEKKDFLERISIVDKTPRIQDVPANIIDQHMRTIRPEHRVHVYERLEGWWNGRTIRMLTGEQTTEVYSREISDKLAAIADEYKTDNLPITFRGKFPEEAIDPENDPRLFVEQLRALNLKPERIQNAILDYFRAFEQRSSWAREHVLLDGEVDEYEGRLIEEWGRYRDVVFETLDETSAESVMIDSGRELYKWAEMNTDHLRIRDRVSEPYVVRGSFHILANERPNPRVYWHPLFLDRLRKVLSTTE